MEPLTSPRILKELVERHGFRFNKGLGQNFLIDENILNKIVLAARIGPEDRVLEVGPGVGTLTRTLAEKALQVTTVEIDKDLLPILQETLKDYSNVTVLHGDILKLDLREMTTDQFGDHSFKVVANLPYYITTPIIMGFLEAELPCETIVVMIQKEVAERMLAKPGTKEYSSLSIAVQYYTSPRMIGKVPASVFMPPPKVDSIVIALDRRDEPPVKVMDRGLFFKVIKAAFAQRRKTLINTLSMDASLGRSKGDWLKILNECGVDPARRGETLSIFEFANITNEIS